MADGIKFEIIDVTPTMARKWLDESNFSNRPLNQHRISKIAHDIKNDKWVFDGTPIRFNGGGQSPRRATSPQRNYKSE